MLQTEHRKCREVLEADPDWRHQNDEEAVEDAAVAPTVVLQAVPALAAHHVTDPTPRRQVRRCEAKDVTRPLRPHQEPSTLACLPRYTQRRSATDPIQAVQKKSQKINLCLIVYPKLQRYTASKLCSAIVYPSRTCTALQHSQAVRIQAAQPYIVAKLYSPVA